MLRKKIKIHKRHSNVDDSSEGLNMETTTKKYQSIVFLLGLCLIGVTFIEFSYGNSLNRDISDYQLLVDQTEQNRDLLVDIVLKSAYVNMEYFALDFDCYASTINGYFNATEAIVRLMAKVMLFSEPYQNLEDFFLSYYGDAETNIDWIFTEQIITLQWLAEDFSTIIPAFETAYDVDNFNQWGTVIYTTTADPYLYGVSYSVLKDWCGNMPFYIVVDFWKFDEYVDATYKEPMAKAERNLAQLNAMVGLSTVGLLIIGFVVDFESVHSIWRFLYYIIALIAITFAIRSSILVFFDLA
jgi:hypothetical protein